MKRFQLVSVALSCILQLSFANAQGNDPTFNGLAETVHCSISSMFLCSGDACFFGQRFAMGPGSNYWISLASRRAGATSVGPWKPIEIIKVSPAALNSDLYVKFAMPVTDDGIPTGLLAFLPNANGGYDIRLGLVVESKKPLGTLPITKTIVGGECDIQNMH